MTYSVTRKEQFTTIYQEHYPKVFRLCKGYFNGDEEQANDIVQEIFIKVTGTAGGVTIRKSNIPKVSVNQFYHLQLPLYYPVLLCLLNLVL